MARAARHESKAATHGNDRAFENMSPMPIRDPAPFDTHGFVGHLPRCTKPAAPWTARLPKVFHARLHRHNTNGPISGPNVHADAGHGPGSYFAHAMEKDDGQLALRVFAEDRVAAEVEQRAWKEQEEDRNHEVFPCSWTSEKYRGFSTLTPQGEDGSGDDGRAVGAAARSSAEDAPSSGVAAPLSAGARAADRARSIVGHGPPRAAGRPLAHRATASVPSAARLHRNSVATHSATYRQRTSPAGAGGTVARLLRR